MTDVPANHESEAGPKDRRPLQFSIRSFFVAAVLVSFYLGAIKSLSEWRLFLVLAALSWLTWGGLLWRFRAGRPLCALAGGPVILVLCWSVYFALGGPARDAGVFGPIVPVTAAFALSWGVIASLFIVLSLGLLRLIRRRASPSGRPVGCLRLARFVALMVVMRMLVSVAVFPAAFQRRDWVCWIAYATNFALDLPYVPVFTDHTTQPSTFDESVWFVIITGVCGAVLYAMVAAMIATIWGWLERKEPSFVEPDPSSQ